MSRWRLFIVASRPNPRYPDAPLMQPEVAINPEIIGRSKRSSRTGRDASASPDRGEVPPASSHPDARYRTAEGLVVEQSVQRLRRAVLPARRRPPPRDRLPRPAREQRETSSRRRSSRSSPSGERSSGPEAESCNSGSGDSPGEGPAKTWLLDSTFPRENLAAPEPTPSRVGQGCGGRRRAEALNSSVDSRTMRPSSIGVSRRGPDGIAMNDPVRSQPSSASGRTSPSRVRGVWWPS